MADNKRVGGGSRGGGQGGGKGRPGPRQPVSQKRGGPAAPGGGARRVGGSASANTSGGFRKTGGSSSAGSGRGAGKPLARSVRPASSGGAGYEKDYKRPTGRPEYSRDEAPRRPRPAPAGGERYERPGRPDRSGRPAEPRPRRTEHAERSAESFHRMDEHPDQHGQDEKVVGLNPVLELLRSGGRPVGTVLIDQEKGGKQFVEIIGLAKQKGISVKIVPKSALDSLSGLLRHQGAVAIVSPKEYSDPYAVVEEALKKNKAPIFLVLDGVEDPHNLGAIIRTAESAGVDGIIIPEHRAAHLTAAVARASAGALEHMPVCKVTNLVQYIDFLKEKGFWVIGLSGESKKDYTSFDMTVPVAAVMGSEGTGIRPIVEKACDELVSLPMMGKVSSLNVSVAAGILLYEVLRQRRERAAKS